MTKKALGHNLDDIKLKLNREESLVTPGVDNLDEAFSPKRQGEGKFIVAGGFEGPRNLP
jgi:hypothetical protein